VSPILSNAVVAAISTFGLSDIEFSGGLPTEATLAEEEHNSLLKLLLSSHGAESVLSAGHGLGLSGDNPILHMLASCSEHAELFEVYERLEPLFHLGNKTIHTMIPNGAHIRHVPRLSQSIHIAESLFICGAQIGMLERIGCTQVHALFDETVVVRPTEHTNKQSQQSISMNNKAIRLSNTWKLTWTSSPSRHRIEAGPSFSRDVERLILEQPARRWKLELVGEVFGTSTRSVQRRLQQESVKFADLLVRTRTNAAEQYLARTSIPINEISLLCGFSDQSHLNAATRRLKGTTPLQIRKAKEDDLMVRRALGR
jgi:AraC-like DNA-binding protein